MQSCPLGVYAYASISKRRTSSRPPFLAADISDPRVNTHRPMTLASPHVEGVRNAVLVLLNLRRRFEIDHFMPMHGENWGDEMHGQVEHE